MIVSHEQIPFCKNDFYGGCRTPIHGIIGMASLALDTDLTVEQRDHLETVSQSADCLLHIVNAILDLAKIESGCLELERVPFSLSGTLGSTMKMLKVSTRILRLPEIRLVLHSTSIALHMEKCSLYSYLQFPT